LVSEPLPSRSPGPFGQGPWTYVAGLDPTAVPTRGAVNMVSLLASSLPDVSPKGVRGSANTCRVDSLVLWITARLAASSLVVR